MPVAAVALYPSFAPLNPKNSPSNVEVYNDNAKFIDQLGQEVVTHQSLLTGHVYDMTAVTNTNGSNVCDVVVSAKDQAGTVVTGAHVFEIWLSDATSGAGLTATTTSGTVTVKSVSGEVIGTLTTKKALMVQSLATGVFTLEITDTAKTAFKVCVKIPGTGLTKVVVTLAGASYG